MNLFFALQESYRDIVSHRMRSFLTMLGVVFGVASLLTMFAITSGMASSLRERLMESGEGEKLIISSAAPPPGQEEIKEISPGLTLRDVEAIRDSSSLVDWVSGSVSLNARARYRENANTGLVAGTDPNFIVMDRHVIKDGRFLTDIDLERKANVAVLGSRFWERLFPEGSESALGKSILINGVQFTVVGTFPRYLNSYLRRAQETGKLEAQKARREARGAQRRMWDPYPWKNNVVAIPVTTMLSVFKSAQVVKGVDWGPDIRLDTIQVGSTNLDLMPELAEQIRNTLLRTHRGIEDFEIDSGQERVEEIDEQVRSVRTSGTIIAAIGLLVGGIGITNIMLASIVDRIREIGIRLAVGARPSDIFLQILMEAVLLSALGGVLGLLLARGLIEFLDRVAQIPNPPIVEPWALLISFSFAIITGVLAGIYPAVKASQLQPVQALKFD